VVSLPEEVVVSDSVVVEVELPLVSVLPLEPELSLVSDLDVEDGRVLLGWVGG
jgi:hypothetical protein